MGNDIQAGENFVDGEACSASRLNKHVGDSEILPTFISLKPLKTEVGLADEFILNDNGVLKKTTIGGIMEAVEIPVGTITDFAGPIAPVGWQLCYGQTLSRITFAELFEIIGITYGPGDGATTFSLPDCRGRVSAGKDNMGGTAANRLVTGGTLGAVGGFQTHTLTAAEMPYHTHTGPYHQHIVPAHYHVGGAHTHTYIDSYPTVTFMAGFQNGPHWNMPMTQIGRTTDSGGAVATSTQGDTWTYAAGDGSTSGAGSGSAHNNLQPTIVFNKIIKV